METGTERFGADAEAGALKKKKRDVEMMMCTSQKPKREVGNVTRIDSLCAQSCGFNCHSK